MLHELNKTKTNPPMSTRGHHSLTTTLGLMFPLLGVWRPWLSRSRDETFCWVLLPFTCFLLNGWKSLSFSFENLLLFSLQVSKLIVLDPHKRLSVREALQHPWVLGKAARFSHMDTTQRKLQEFNARRKLKVNKLILWYNGFKNL